MSSAETGPRITSGEKPDMAPPLLELTVWQGKWPRGETRARRRQNLAHSCLEKSYFS